MNSGSMNESHGLIGFLDRKLGLLITFSVSQWKVLLLLLLFVAVVFVSIKKVVQRHDSRMAYIELQQHEKERDRLVAQWSRLKLEQAATINQVRVEQYARWDLGMKMPKTSEVRIIQEQQKKLTANKQSPSESVNQSKMVMDN